MTVYKFRSVCLLAVALASAAVLSNGAALASERSIRMDVYRARAQAEMGVPGVVFYEPRFKFGCDVGLKQVGRSNALATARELTIALYAPGFSQRCHQRSVDLLDLDLGRGVRASTVNVLVVNDGNTPRALNTDIGAIDLSNNRRVRTLNVGVINSGQVQGSRTLNAGVVDLRNTTVRAVTMETYVGSVGSGNDVDVSVLTSRGSTRLQDISMQTTIRGDVGRAEDLRIGVARVDNPSGSLTADINTLIRGDVSSASNSLEVGVLGLHGASGSTSLSAELSTSIMGGVR